MVMPGASSSRSPPPPRLSLGCGTADKDSGGFQHLLNSRPPHRVHLFQPASLGSRAGTKARLAWAPDARPGPVSRGGHREPRGCRSCHVALPFTAAFRCGDTAPSARLPVRGTWTSRRSSEVSPQRHPVQGPPSPAPPAGGADAGTTFYRQSVPNCIRGSCGAEGHTSKVPSRAPHVR